MMHQYIVVLLRQTGNPSHLSVVSFQFFGEVSSGRDDWSLRSGRRVEFLDLTDVSVGGLQEVAERGVFSVGRESMSTMIIGTWKPEEGREASNGSDYWSEVEVG